MKKEKGYVMVLVLILLGVSSLAIGSTISYISSGLKSFQVTEDVMIEQYSADAALEDAIWHLKNNIEFPDNPGVNRESLSPGGTTSVTYPITINGMDVSVEIGLPDTLPDSPQLGHALLLFMLERDPRWVKVGEPIDYDFTLTNKHNNKTLDIAGIGAKLQPGVEYIAGSSSGASTDEPTITYEQGYQKLYWPFSYQLAGHESIHQYFSADTEVDGGMYYASAGANYRSDSSDWEPFDTGMTAPAWVGTYHIKAKARKTVTESFISLTQTGGVIDGATIFNWKEQ